MYKLYWAAGTAALAPQAILEEAGAPYEIVALDLGKQEHRRPEYLALNPAGLVPTLVTDDGQVLTESAAITVALCERHPDAGLIPGAGDPARCSFFRWLFYLTNTVQEAFKRFYFPGRFSTDPADAPRIKERAASDLAARWRIVEDRLADPGPYLLVERFSAADIFLVMLATWFESRAGLFEMCPKVGRCFALAAERPALRRTLEANGEL
ncbi:MAG: glutathione S-transferase family protein [Rhodospirillales bacterium]|nr:glutathione S-transferase family protein [Rhodospirillales bacterium]MDH3910200.1 glutathione S-transferase family protein [Rhodospirillales bacterium]MDH3918794.1 glutathione S-transferase family protein [Rhodospirillales bacterium]MDH3970290.1 glutathione S-transferase family protein [Rhodospirillales bacterium]